MTAMSLLERNAQPGDEEIRDAMATVICRCGTYQRIHRAIKRASNYMAEEKQT
jgi:aerobic-type carbon monoxide dehydrogenase small subunit (CoxS/CutS family)